jgi:hypothetical protein
LFGILSIENQGFQMGVMQLDLSRLERFAISIIPLVDEKTIGNALKQMCNLKTLLMIDAPNYTTDENLQIVFQHCKRLEHLQLAGSKNVSTVCYFKVIGWMKRNIHNCRSVWL